MGRLIVLRVRQVVDCLLSPHYLSVTWGRIKGRELPVLSLLREEQIALLVAALCVTPVAGPPVSALLQPFSSCRLESFGLVNKLTSQQLPLSGT